MTDARRAMAWDACEFTHDTSWRSERGAPPPAKVVLADDRIKADEAWRLACEGTALLWQGDFQNARQLLQAMGRRIDARKARKPNGPAPTPSDAFNQYRQGRAQRARTLGMLLVPLDADYAIPLRRGPDVRAACEEAYGPAAGPSIVSLRELLGLISAHEWRRKGVLVPALGERIHPWYGVFSPVRGEYVDLVAEAPLPVSDLAFDIGTGTGVLAAVLLRRGVARVVATDQDPRALGCARENLERLGLRERVELVQANLFPDGRAGLVVCNPPWVPARPTAPLERAVFDPDSAMLKGFLDGLAAHLLPGGEGWLILSDLAEHFGLRSRAELLEMVGQAGLKVLRRSEVAPRHARASDAADPLHAARAMERTSLWCLGVA